MTKINYSYDEKKALSLLEAQKLAHTSNKLLDEFDATSQKIVKVFEDFNAKDMLVRTSFAFVIPTRASRLAADYWEEVYELFPALRHMSHHDAFAILALMPPMRVIYYGEKDSPSGVVIFAPIFGDMMHDYRLKIRLIYDVRKRINDAVDFAYRRYGVSYVGLGATLPRLTNYGKSIKTPVITTTGHAGTAWLLSETVRSVVSDFFGKRPKESLTIGFIGGGAIGAAAMQVLAPIYPDARFLTYDRRHEVNRDNQRLLYDEGKQLEIAESNHSLIEQSDLIISAITSTIPLGDIDLTGKVIIDDSQPGSFNRAEVEKRGGVLTWVIGHDTSKRGFVTRQDGYRFGPHGLAHANDIWGCEAEVAAIADSGNTQYAVQGPVTHEDVIRIGHLLASLGISRAEYQSHGEANKS